MLARLVAAASVFLVAILLMVQASASETVQRLCDDSGTDACLVAAAAFLKASNYERAEPLAATLCTAGEADGCLILGIAAAEQGKLELALTGYGQACDGGAAAACPLLGDLLILGARTYEPGWSFERGWSEALALFERACDLDDGYGCSRAATIYGGGLGVARQPERAARLRRKACTLGETGACWRPD